MKLFIRLITLTFSLNTFAAIGGGGQEGNGGGGIRRNGRMMSFYSAGLYAEPTGDSSAVPQLDKLIDTVAQMDILTTDLRSRLFKALLPTDGRNYMRVNSFDETSKKRLLEEFKRVTKVDTTDLELFAVTDTNAKTTFLLPTFYALSAIDQMAILFHEAYWIVNPYASYQKVVDVEMSFQAVLSEPNNMNRKMEFIRQIGTEGNQMVFAFKHDMATGALKKLIRSDGLIYFSDLFGTTESNRYREFEDYLATNFDYLVRLSRSMPDSLVLKVFIKAILSKNESVRAISKDWTSSSRGWNGNFDPGAQCAIETKITQTPYYEGFRINCGPHYMTSSILAFWPR